MRGYSLNREWHTCAVLLTPLTPSGVMHSINESDHAAESFEAHPRIVGSDEADPT